MPAQLPAVQQVIQPHSTARQHCCWLFNFAVQCTTRRLAPGSSTKRQHTAAAVTRSPSACTTASTPLLLTPTGHSSEWPCSCRTCKTAPLHTHTHATQAFTTHTTHGVVRLPAAAAGYICSHSTPWQHQHTTAAGQNYYCTDYGTGACTPCHCTTQQHS